MKNRPSRIFGAMSALLAIVGLGGGASPAAVQVNKPYRNRLVPFKNPGRPVVAGGRSRSNRRGVSVRDLIRRARTSLELQLAITKGQLYARASDKTRRRWAEAIADKQLELNQGAAT
jgi:hypothetical protein